MVTGYSPDEMRRYWRQHSRQWRDLDRAQDPEGLTNVCYNGAPLWLNRLAAFCQRRAFLKLLATVGSLEGRRALDVGCGTGRWVRLLHRQGASVTGIDLQPETLADNRRRLPECRFLEMSADAMGFARGSFDLVTSVTVLQHIPYESQGVALCETRRVLVPGGWAIFLEATRDRGPHVFSNSPEQWSRKAREAGYEVVRLRPYDFASLVHAARDLAARLRRGPGEGSPLPPVEEYVSRFRSPAPRRGLARSAYHAALRAAALSSYPAEMLAPRIAPASWAHHVGILLRAA